MLEEIQHFARDLYSQDSILGSLDEPKGAASSALFGRQTFSQPVLLYAIGK